MGEYFIEPWQESSPENITAEGMIAYAIYYKNNLLGFFDLHYQATLKEVIDRTEKWIIDNSSEWGHLGKVPIKVPWHPEHFTTHCWGLGCRSLIDRRWAKSNEPYGHVCSCGLSLRTHPFFGQGREFDKGNPEKWQKWCAMSKTEKAAVYARYRSRL